MTAPRPRTLNDVLVLIDRCAKEVGLPTRRSLALTGETYRAIAIKLQISRAEIADGEQDKVIAAAATLFWDALQTELAKPGVLYWREPPDLTLGNDFDTRGIHGMFYARLLVSEKRPLAEHIQLARKDEECWVRSARLPSFAELRAAGVNGEPVPDGGA
jgi:hypothetical protein